MKELLKDFRVIIYFALGIFSIFYVIASITSINVRVISSPILPNGSYVYYIDGCKVTSSESFYSCIRNETLIVKTSEGNILVKNPSLLYRTKVKEERGVKFGIDLVGGTRLILKAKDNISYSDLILSAMIIERRLNSYGLKSIDIRTAQDSFGNKYLIVELPPGEEHLIDVIKKVGKFEAKIGNITVFTGEDILSVKTYPPFGGIRTCYRSGNQYACEFYFTVVVSKKASEKFAEATKNLSVVFEYGKAYLSKELELYIDGKLTDKLRISADLKGKAIQEFKVSGPGYGKTLNDARKKALDNMKALATVIAYGSLPTTFEIERIEKIPPKIGRSILSSVFIAGILAFIAIFVLILVVYRKLKPAILITGNMIIEIFITIALGILLGQTIDLPALAGVLIAIGTGVDDQILTVEEILRGKKELKVEQKIWKILFIVLSSFLVIVFAMLPLLFAALGLFRGFAVMTIIGAFVGAFITRPAFVKIAEKVL